MGVRITDWRCSTPGCGTRLANVVEVDTGWLERRCWNCGRFEHIGVERKGDAPVKLRCDPVGAHQHTIGEVSQDWQGAVSIRCRQCKTDTVIPRSK